MTETSRNDTPPKKTHPLTGAFLVGTDLCYARLAETDFEGAWLFGANLEGAQLDYGRLTGAYYEADLIVGWLSETIGVGPWRWWILRERFDTPSGASLSIFLQKLTRRTDRPIDREQAREGLRQIGFFLETQLNASAEDEIQDLRVAQILTIRGIFPDARMAPNGPDAQK